MIQAVVRFILPAMVVAVLLAMGAYLLRRRLNKARRPFVIGEEYASAVRAEENHLAKGGFGPSPLAGKTYDLEKGELSLYRPAPCALDDEIRLLVERFDRLGPTDQSKLSDSLVMDDLHTLLDFARRAAVFGLRTRSVRLISHGVSAVAMLDPERIDVRDALVALAYLHHAAKRAGADADGLFRQAASQGGKSAGLLRGFAARSERDKALRTAWLADEVETEAGSGFIGWNDGDYRPTKDLKPLVMAIADLLSTDEYNVSTVSVADELPGFWLEPSGRAAAPVRGLRAVGHVVASPRSAGVANGMSQNLMLWVAEAEEEGTARILADRAQERSERDWAVVTIASGRLFCLVVARSLVVDHPTLETDATLSRFSEGLAGLLHRHSSR